MQDSQNTWIQKNINNNDKYVVNGSCYSFHNNDCYIHLDDTTKIQNTLADTSLPIYVFPKDISNLPGDVYDLKSPVQCWSLDQDAYPSIMLSTGSYDGCA